MIAGFLNNSTSSIPSSRSLNTFIVPSFSNVILLALVAKGAFKAPDSSCATCSLLSSVAYCFCGAYDFAEEHHVVFVLSNEVLENSCDQQRRHFGVGPPVRDYMNCVVQPHG
eukprot:TRINITY_DN12571_c0_g2_i1.p3 TRINITY_DN12571_c0_g2~~TRINITY_DN12571_c0_g2_i1.p3  ORF type:complete len:112 (+),score=8.11 TRINITY_DN12571_c0_g2_i1:310-645(+)